MEEVDKGCPMIRMGVSGWMFLLITAYLVCPGPKAIKRLCVCCKRRYHCDNAGWKSVKKCKPGFIKDRNLWTDCKNLQLTLAQLNVQLSRQQYCHVCYYFFTARCYASAVLAMALCPSACPSQVGVLLKRLNVGSHKQHHTIAQGI